MRISQIKTLCWLSNGLVLIGAGYVGLHFWKTFRARSVRAAVAWPDKKGGDVIEQRWPGPITGFTDIWITPVNGLKPPPKETAKPVETKRDIAREFLTAYSFTGMLFDASDPIRSVAFVTKGSGQAGVTVTARAGSRIQEFTLVGFDVSGDTTALVFTHPKVEGLIRMQPGPVAKSDLANGVFRPLVSWTDLAGPEIKPDVIESPAYQDVLVDPSGLTWRMTLEETGWWAKFGESLVLSKMSVENKTDGEGRPVGITIRSQPGQGTPVATSRGIGVGDTIKAINGVTVGTKEDILRYLRGDGRGLERYEVLVENETGSERTVVYLVTRYHRS